jgi:chemotaxis family two-component system response regulator PixG
MQELKVLPHISIPPKKPIHDFFGTKQSSLFHAIKKVQFTGELSLSSLNKNRDTWTFYFYLGRIIHATGGTHPIKRWMRSVKKVLPKSVHKLYVIDLQALPNSSEQLWDYELLRFWLAKGMLTVKNINDIVYNIVLEILFDISQANNVIYEISPYQPIANPLIFINPDHMVYSASDAWNNWQNAQLADRCPNKAPIILRPREIEKVMSERNYKLSQKYFNGQNTLRDLSVLLNRDIILVTKVILPYLQKSLLQLVSIADVPNPLENKGISDMINVN